jgi:catechol 2,3-dioxygenase-like lactoylglutathione lyase family enzyme
MVVISDHRVARGTMRVNEILETCVYVDNLDAAADFYQQVLGLQLYSRQEGRHVFFRCGDRMLLLFDAQGTLNSSSELPPHGCTGEVHVAFGVPEKDLDKWKQRLVEAEVVLELDYHWPQGGRSLYFRDPSGNSLELTTPRIWDISENTLP